MVASGEALNWSSSGGASAASRWLQVFRSFLALKPKLTVGLKPCMKPPWSHILKPTLTAPIVSIELSIYNSGLKNAEVFSAKGDSGSLVWHTKDSKAYIVGQLHSGGNKGGSTSNHVTYCTPGWYLLSQIKKQYKYANFYPTTWPAWEQHGQLSQYLLVVFWCRHILWKLAGCKGSSHSSTSPFILCLTPPSDTPPPSDSHALSHPNVTPYWNSEWPKAWTVTSRLTVTMQNDSVNAR